MRAVRGTRQSESVSSFGEAASGRATGVWVTAPCNQDVQPSCSTEGYGRIIQPRPMSLTPGATLGPYTIRAQLGHGGMVNRTGNVGERMT